MSCERARLVGLREDADLQVGFLRSYAFTKRGIAFTLANQLRVEVFKFEKEGENEVSSGCESFGTRRDENADFFFFRSAWWLEGGRGLHG